MTLNRLKISTLWFEPLPGLLAERAGREPELPSAARAVSRASTYQELFDKARRNQGPFTLPWRMDTLSYFWRYYLDRNPPDRVDAWEAWDRLVPLRRGAEILGNDRTAQLADADGSRFQIESFHYPHGTGLVATVVLEASLELEAAVDRVRETLRGDVLQVSGPALQERTSVPRLVSGVFESLREAPGDTDQEDCLRTDSFSIVTVLSGDAPPSWTGPEPPDRLRLALQGFCTGDSRWRRDSLLGLERCVLWLRHRKGQEDLLFGVGRGRAVWFPSRFVPSGPKNRSLGCYHRNLTLASLQTESLLQLVRITSDRLEGSTPPLPVRWEEVARRGALLLGGLYAGRGSYASWSTLTQIRDDKELLRKADRVRAYFGLLPLRRSHPGRPEAHPEAVPGEAGEALQEQPAIARMN